ncbi:hypothetical protein VTJ83DRAFT_4913 [Remersonia thermophila]|uniref:NOT2/NOT3/NOT5 C-terminal domain-containing protein n=1 Tax=Remersonia thermophila TaxID=72144 RepID=A0ABR4DCT3_9PEZI
MMNRPGAVPQALRGMPGGFGAQQPQQQQQQAGRAVTGRLPNGKIGPVGNAAGWPFGGMPMGGSANVPPGAARQIGGNVSFAQTLTGSQPQTPLDLSEFPSLSNTSQLNAANASTMWPGQAARNLGGGAHRGAGTPLAQQSQQDDMYQSRLASAQSSFRFGNQGAAAQAAQGQAGAADDFPPLNRGGNGDIGGQDRRGSMMTAAMGFGAQGAAASGAAAMHANRAGNGLLNALSGANARAIENRTPTAIARPQDTRSPAGEDEKQAHFRDDGPDGTGGRNPPGAIGTNPSSSKAKEEEKANASQVQDPLEGMAPIDKWGLKGLRTLMNNFPDYNALTCGLDPATLGIEMRSGDLLSTKVYSLFDDVPPRSPIPKFHLPECYSVQNVQPIEAKISSFNEETLMWIFYSCPRDIKQQMAAIELNNRNWRWHKKLQLWLTKDDVMVPQSLGPTHERGYYVVWDTVNWRKERRELMLHYADLDTSPTVQLQGLGA